MNMSAPFLKLICIVCVTVACAVLLIVNISAARDDARATVRLLRHGDKIDVRLSEMRGTQPWVMADAGLANVVRPDLFAAAGKGGVI